MRVDHEPDVGANRAAHPLDGFDILLWTQSRPHLVGAESQAGDGGGLLGVLHRIHVHAGAAVEADAVAHASAEELGKWNALRLGRQIVQGHLHRAIHLPRLQIR